MSVDTRFNIIYDKLQQLLKQYNRVKKENEQLKKELEQQKQLDEQSKQKVEELHQQISILKLAAGEMDDKDKKEFEKKINRYIKELDKTIAYLSK